MLKGVDPDSRDNYGNTILIVACQNGNKRIAKLSLRYGSKINLFNIMGNTALHFCYEYKYFDLAEYLISKGANQNIKNIRNLKSNEGIRTKTQNNLSDNSNLINSQKNKASQSKYNNYNFANISSQKSSVDLSLDFNEVNFRFINKKNDKQSIDDKLRNMGIDKMELSAIERLTQVGRKATVVKFEEIKISNDCEK